MARVIADAAVLDPRPRTVGVTEVRRLSFKFYGHGCKHYVLDLEAELLDWAGNIDRETPVALWPLHEQSLFGVVTGFRGPAGGRRAASFAGTGPEAPEALGGRYRGPEEER
jgi:hypothetical protein